MSASTFTTLRAYGGPLDGQGCLTSAQARFYWLVTTPRNHLVATTGTLEYADVQGAEGCYVRQTKKEGRTTREVLMYMPTPGAKK